MQSMLDNNEAELHKDKKSKQKKKILFTNSQRFFSIIIIAIKNTNT